MLKDYIKKLRTYQQKKTVNILDIPEAIFPSEETVGSEQYFDNVIVHRCVSLIASSASHVPWLVYKNKGVKRFLPTTILLPSYLKNLTQKLQEQISLLKQFLVYCSMAIAMFF
jgi:hypothetical protein